MSAAIPLSTLDKFTTFGDLLRYLRRRAGITQIDLSLAVGYSNAQISRLEQNLRPPDLTTIEARFVPALGLDHDPQAIGRLLELAANVRREDAPAAGLCPYKGLSYFDEEDADLFVGREALTAKLAGRVLGLAANTGGAGPRLLAVVGASGSGKSSVVRAGLVPALRWGSRSAGWPIYTLTPTVHPLESLALSLAEEGEAVVAAAHFAEDLARHPHSLHLYCTRLAKAAGASRLLLVVDQFEELFSLCRMEAERLAFIAGLLNAASDVGGPTLVVITLRADFYSHCAAYPELREALSQRQEYIGSLNDDELRRAIEEPARRGRWEFEPGLVDLLIHDVGHEPGALPLLSHALRETWERRRGHTMTLGGYASAGGVRGAIAETAQAVFTDSFTPEQQAIARRIFLHLTELGVETGTGDTRRRASFDELIVEPSQSEATRVVLTALADSRLITITRDAVEVAHEALIREWPTLRGWLEEDREGLRLHRHLADTARDWAGMDREHDMLYRGARLLQAREWAAKNPDEITLLEREFLDASLLESDRAAAEKEAQRQNELAAAQKLVEAERQRAEEQERASGLLRLRNRIISAVGAATLLLAILAGVFAWQSGQNARRAGQNMALAQANLGRAKSLGWAIAAETLLAHGGDVEAAVLLSIRALQASYTPEADAALAHALDYFRLQQTYEGHTGWIHSVAVSPDGKYVLTGSNDGSARLWDLHSGKELRRFIEPSAGVATVAFSPDAKYVATGNNAGLLRIWDAGSGVQLRSWAGHADGITSVMFSPDGRSLLTAGGDKTARLWDAASGQLIWTLSGHERLVADAAFSPDGKHVLTGSLDSTARLWDAATGEVVRVFMNPHPALPNGDVNGVAFSPHGDMILIGRSDRTADLWNADSGEQLCALSGHDYAVNAVAFSPDGRYAATASNDGTAIVWSADTCEKVEEYADYGPPAFVREGVKALSFSPDARYLLTGGFDHMARLWSTPEGPPLRTFLPASPGVGSASKAERISSIALSPDGGTVISGGAGHLVRLWDRESGAQLHVLAGHTDAVNAVAFSADGRLALTGSADRTIRLWDVAAARQLRSIDTGISNVTGVAFSPDGKHLFATGTPATGADQLTYAMSTRVWDAATGRLLRAFDFGGDSDISSGTGIGLAVSADGQRVLVRNLGNGAMLFDVFSNEMICDFADTPGEIGSVSLSRDGRYALTGGFDKTARLWDISTCDELRSFPGNTGAILSVAFSPDSRFVLTGQDDNSARLWDLATGTLLRQFSGHTGPVNSAVFSADGRYVLTGSQDGTVRLWDTDYHDSIRFACSILMRDLTREERQQYGITDISPTCSVP